MVMGAQDNGNMKYNAGVFTNITNADGMRGFIDWSNPNNIFVSIQNGGLYRSTNGGATFTRISTPSGGSWVTPWGQDATAAATIYAGTNKGSKSNNTSSKGTTITRPLEGV